MIVTSNVEPMGGGRPGGPTTDDDKHPHIDEDAFGPEDAGRTSTGEGGVVSPGGKQPKPKEDPRKDSGLYNRKNPPLGPDGKPLPQPKE